LAKPNHTEAVQDLVWQMSDADWHAVTNASYKKLVKHSALRRISYKKLRMNLQAISPSFFNESNGVG
jgi:epoxyqueuosine reductase QueG